MMKIEDIKRVLILGAGTMGQQIGLQCAIYGYEVIFYDLNQEILDKAFNRITKLASWYASVGRLPQEKLQQTLGRITLMMDPVTAAWDVDIVSESVPEDPKIKGKIFGQFHKLCPERTIFTTNASMLVASMFAEETLRSNKFCALHFHDLRATTVVDVMPHPGTDPLITKLVCDFAESIGGIVIFLHRENQGYVFNTMLASLFMSALTLAANEVSSVRDIDRAWMGVTYMSMGPFGLMDQVGLDTVWSIIDYWANKQKDVQLQKNAEFVKQYIEIGELGYKTKRGFYTYPKPEYGQDGFLVGKTKK